MTEYSVYSPDLEGYSQQVGRVGDHSKAALSYFNQHTSLSPLTRGLVFGWLMTTHNRVVSASQDVFSELSQKSSESATALKAAARYYRQADEDAARKADATYGDPKRIDRLPAVRQLTTGIINWEDRRVPAHQFKDGVDPQSKLTPPVAPEMSPVTKLLKNPFGVLDYFSPTNAVLEVWKLLGFTDPIDEYVKVLGGDWEAVHKAGTAMINIADCIGAISSNIDYGNRSLDESWHGRAADASFQYFSTLHAILNRQATEFKQLGQGYRQVAEAMWQLADTGGSLIKGMIDTAVIVALAASTAGAGVAAAETGVGAIVAVIASGTCAWEIFVLWQKYTKLTALLNVGASTWNIIRGLGNMALAQKSLPRELGLPASAYSHPALAKK
ncbi:hypothetical protein [Actinomadura sp. 9N407]|uniref:hypothetical protein n=1 Tax=Actinomadura sp. 9N407 TaxID=3375154 RepID=UPI003788CE4E